MGTIFSCEIVEITKLNKNEYIVFDFTGKKTTAHYYRSYSAARIKCIRVQSNYINNKK